MEPPSPPPSFSTRPRNNTTKLISAYEIKREVVWSRFMKFSGFTIPSSFFFRRCSVVYDVAFPPYESFLFFSSSSFHLLWNKIIILFFSSCYIYRWEIIFENWYNKFYYGCFCSWNKVSSLVFSFFFFNEKLIIIQNTIYSRVVQVLFRGNNCEVIEETRHQYNINVSLEYNTISEMVIIIEERNESSSTSISLRWHSSNIIEAQCGSNRNENSWKIKK